MATEYISKAWQVYKKNALSFIASELVANIIPGLLIFFGFMVFLSSVLPGLDLNFILENPDEEILSQYLLELFNNPDFLISLGNGALGFGIFALVSILLSLYLSIGQVGMAYESLKRRTQIRTMFRVSGKLGFRWISTTCLLFIFGMIALIPLMIIGVFTLGMGIIVGVALVIPIISLIAPAMVVDNASPVDSIKKAFKVAKRNYLNLFALWLIYIAGMIGISFVGGLTSVIPIIGWATDLSSNLFVGLVLAPMMKISFVDFYLRNRKRV